MVHLEGSCFMEISYFGSEIISELVRYHDQFNQNVNTTCPSPEEAQVARKKLTATEMSIANEINNSEEIKSRLAELLFEVDNDLEAVINKIDNDWDMKLIFKRSKNEYPFELKQTNSKVGKRVDWIYTAAFKYHPTKNENSTIEDSIRRHEEGEFAIWYCINAEYNVITDIFFLYGPNAAEVLRLQSKKKWDGNTLSISPTLMRSQYKKYCVELKRLRRL